MLDDREIQRLVRVCQRADAGGEAGADAGEDPAEAWAALYSHFRPRIRNFCRRTLTGDIGDDLAEEVLMKARFRLDGFDAARPFGPWLFRIAANRCWDETRRRRRSEPLDDEGARSLPSDGPSPLDRLITAESRTRVREALAKVPVRQRFALTLRYAADFSYQEIADTLGVTPNHVGVLLLRGRRRMRELLVAREA